MRAALGACLAVLLIGLTACDSAAPVAAPEPSASGSPLGEATPSAAQGAPCTGPGVSYRVRGPRRATEPIALTEITVSPYSSVKETTDVPAYGAIVAHVRIGSTDVSGPIAAQVLRDLGRRTGAVPAAVGSSTARLDLRRLVRLDNDVDLNMTFIPYSTTTRLTAVVQRRGCPTDAGTGWKDVGTVRSFAGRVDDVASCGDARPPAAIAAQWRRLC